MALLISHLFRIVLYNEDLEMLYQAKSVVQANLMSVLIIQYHKWGTEPENNSVLSIVFAVIICILYI